MSDPAETATDDISRKQNRQSSVRDEIRGNVDRTVGEAIERETDHIEPEERSQVESVAKELKAKSFSELRQSEREMGSGRRLKRIYQFVAYAFYIVYGLIGLMIGLELLGARDWSGFMKFMQLVTTPILAPFRNVMPDPAVGSFQLMLSYVLALVVYGLAHLAVKGAFRILIHRDGKEL